MTSRAAHDLKTAATEPVTFDPCNVVGAEYGHPDRIELPRTGVVRNVYGGLRTRPARSYQLRRVADGVVLAHVRSLEYAHKVAGRWRDIGIRVEVC